MIYSKNISTNNYLNHNSKSKSKNNERNKINTDLVTKWKTNDKHLQWKGIRTCKKPLEEIVTTTYL